MMEDELKIQETADGSLTLYSEHFHSSYHSMHGAITESEHVFIQNGLERLLALGVNDIYIFEMGFGTGLNAWLTAKYAIKHQLNITYTAIDVVVLPEASMFKILKDELHSQILFSDWNQVNTINEYFKLEKLECALTSFLEKTTSRFNLIYYDAFGPGSQPELWEDDIFYQLYTITLDQAVFTTYCAKGSVRRALQLAGFQSQKIAGPPGKRHMIIAIKPPASTLV